MGWPNIIVPWHRHVSLRQRKKAMKMAFRIHNYYVMKGHTVEKVTIVWSPQGTVGGALATVN